jgi:hypothetical protein
MWISPEQLEKYTALGTRQLVDLMAENGYSMTVFKASEFEGVSTDEDLGELIVHYRVVYPGEDGLGDVNGTAQIYVDKYGNVEVLCGKFYDNRKELV